MKQKINFECKKGGSWIQAKKIIADKFYAQPKKTGKKQIKYDKRENRDQIF